MNKYVVAIIMFASCSFFGFSFYNFLGFKDNDLPKVDVIIPTFLD